MTYTLRQCQIFCSIFLLTLCGGFHLHMASAGVSAPSANGNRNLFATNIFEAVVSDKLHENVAFSPASVQAALALLYLGAEGHTAQEMQTGLQLGVGNKETIAAKYGDFLRSTFNRKEDGAQLNVANALFVNQNYEIAPKFLQFAKSAFNAEAKSMNFGSSGNAVDEINGWVERQTDSKIKDLLTPDTVDEGTSAVLVNALYFKAKWVHPFSEHATQKDQFVLSANERVEVELMYNSDIYRYADLDDLDSKALEMAYKDTNMTMLVLLPNKIDGLQNLEKSLKSFDLKKVDSQLSTHDVDVFLPKFTVEFEVDLKKPLEKLGVTSIFGNNANLSGLFTSGPPQTVAEAKHKVCLNVNEAGSEAAAATYLKIIPMSLNLNQKVFRADHPFVYAIRNSETVFFIGHIAKF